MKNTEPKDFESTLARIEALEPGLDLSGVHEQFDQLILAAVQRTADALAAHQTAVVEQRKLIEALADKGYSGF